MKISKAFLISIVTTFFVFFIATNASYQDSDPIKEDVKVEIYKTTSKEEIDKTIEDLALKGIDLYIDKLVYSSNGKRIIDIAGRIDCNDGNSGSFNSGRFFRKIEIVKNYSSGAPVSFGVYVN